MRPSTRSPTTRPSASRSRTTSESGLVARGDAAEGVVGEHAEPAVVGALLDESAECVEGEVQRLLGAVGAAHDLPGRVVGVGQGAAVEVGLGDQAPRLVVGVVPRQALRVGHPDQAQLAVVGQVRGRAVRGGLGDRHVERAVGARRGPSGDVGVGDDVALAVVRPALRRAVGQRACGQPALRGPRQAGGGPGRVGRGHDPAQLVALQRRGAPQRVRHGDHEAGLVGGHAGDAAVGAGHRGQAAPLVVGVRRGSAGRVDHAGAVAAVVVLVPPHRPVGEGDAARAVQRPGVLPLLGRPVGPHDPHEAPASSCSKRVTAPRDRWWRRAGRATVPLLVRGVAQRVDDPLDLQQRVEVVGRGGAHRVGAPGGRDPSSWTSWSIVTARASPVPLVAVQRPCSSYS